MSATVLLAEDAAPRASSIDWSSLLRVADDPELAELLETPVENAVRILRFYSLSSKIQCSERDAMWRSWA